MNDILPASPSPSLLPALRVGLAAWACAALAVSISGVFEFPPPYVIPLIIGGSVVAFSAAYAGSRAFRATVLSIDPRPLVLFHLVRVVAGVGFLVEHQRGLLPGVFALQAGWGDIIVGLLAPLAALALPANTRAKRGLALAWSVAGLLDILYVVVNAQRLVLIEGDTLLPATLTRFPYALLPLFIVPLVLITHGVVLARLLGARPDTGHAGR